MRDGSNSNHLFDVSAHEFRGYSANTSSRSFDLADTIDACRPNFRYVFQASSLNIRISPKISSQLYPVVKQCGFWGWIGRFYLMLLCHACDASAEIALCKPPSRGDSPMRIIDPEPMSPIRVHAPIVPHARAPFGVIKPPFRCDPLGPHRG